MRITRAMREDGVDYQEVDSSEVVSEECTHINALLMDINIDSDIQLFRLPNKKQRSSTIEAYGKMNELYKNIGLYVRYHNKGEYLLVAGGNFDEEEFERQSKTLDKAVETVTEIFKKRGK